MNKFLTGFFISLTALALFSAVSLAAPEAANEEPGLFEGTFTGTVNGDENSEATLTLELTDQDNLVAGTASLGGGLLVDAGGLCGSTILPASTMRAEGQKSAGNPDELTTESTIDVAAFEVTVEVAGELSSDGETLEVEAKIDTPWICGRDPVIMGTLTKVT